MSISLLSFALGILTVIAVVEAIVLVVGFVKVIRLESDFSDYKRDIEEVKADQDRTVAFNLSELERDIQSRTDNLWMETDNIRSYVDSRIDKTFCKA